MDSDDYDNFLFYLENEKGKTKGAIRNYIKIIKAFFRWYCDDHKEDIPDWVARLKLGKPNAAIQPNDLPTREEFFAFLNAATNPRSRALIAVSADAGIRIGASDYCVGAHIHSLVRTSRKTWH